MFHTATYMMTGSRNRRSRRPRPNNRGNNSAVVTRSQLKRENHLIENGAKLRPSPHPTDFMAIPWFPLTVQIQGAASITIASSSTTTAVSIFSAIRTQLFLNTNQPLQVRIQSARIWGPLLPMNASTSLQPLRARFLALNPTTFSAAAFPAVLEDVVAYPDQVSRASLGYVWPKTQQALALESSGNESIPFIQIAGTPVPGNLLYVRVLFRTFSQSLSSETITDDFEAVTSPPSSRWF